MIYELLSELQPDGYLVLGIPIPVYLQSQQRDYISLFSIWKLETDCELPVIFRLKKYPGSDPMKYQIGKDSPFWLTYQWNKKHKNDVTSRII